MHHHIAVIGLGYVGLPLSVLFSEKYKVTGFDSNAQRVDELKTGTDRTLEVSGEDLKKAIDAGINGDFGLGFTCNENELSDANIYIITVPTPVDKSHTPELSALKNASETVAKVLKPGNLVIYESTVYPGTTEEVCVPILEKISGLQFNRDFFIGYSPERINPGDKERRVQNIIKITSGSTPEIATKVDKLYNSVIEAGTYPAPSIKVAEAAKVIENAQRDINIAFINELSKIFSLMQIDTQEVLKAAATKWNFLNFSPGLVGGHCTGVDPYYLAHRAQQFGYHPEIILAGRRLNDSMGNFVAAELVKAMLKKNINIKAAEILVLGFTFKENCTDIRNTKVIDVIKNLQEFGAKVSLFDPWANSAEIEKEHGLKNMEQLTNKKYDAIVLAVPHADFLKLNIRDYLAAEGLIYDVKGVLEKDTDILRL